MSQILRIAEGDGILVRSIVAAEYGTTAPMCLGYTAPRLIGRGNFSSGIAEPGVVSANFDAS